MPFSCDQPAVPTVQQDDANVRITRWDFAPGAATGYHSHGWPYFVVMLTDAVMKIEATDGAVSEVRLVAGQSYQRPSGVEHDVMNGSDQPMAFVEIESQAACSSGARLRLHENGRSRFTRVGQTRVQPRARSPPDGGGRSVLPRSPRRRSATARTGTAASP